MSNMYNFKEIFDKRFDVEQIIKEVLMISPNCSDSVILSVCIRKLCDRIDRLEFESKELKKLLDQSSKTTSPNYQNTKRFRTWKAGDFEPWVEVITLEDILPALQALEKISELKVYDITGTYPTEGSGIARKALEPLRHLLTESE